MWYDKKQQQRQQTKSKRRPNREERAAPGSDAAGGQSGELHEMGPGRAANRRELAGVVASALGERGPPSRPHYSTTTCQSRYSTAVVSAERVRLGVPHFSDDWMGSDVHKCTTSNI